eukprot:SAG31_NODE_47_length_30979_cov_41.708841_16_plen_55_part_00
MRRKWIDVSVRAKFSSFDVEHMKSLAHDRRASFVAIAGSFGPGPITSARSLWME